MLSMIVRARRLVGWPVLVPDSLLRALRHHLLGLGDCLGGVQPLRAGVGAIHDRVAAVEAERIVELIETLPRVLVPAVGEPALRLQEDGRAEILVGVPPVARARGRAAEA